jgi:uncharacterized protein (DUF433 family)
MATTPVSVRLDDDLLDWLQHDAAARGATLSGTVHELLTEGRRTRAVPGIVFRPGPTGRRPGVAGGPDVWEIVTALKTADSRQDAAIAEVADDLGLTTGQVTTALDYYARWPDEIDAWINRVERAADEAYEAWQARRRVLM